MASNFTENVPNIPQGGFQMNTPGTGAPGGGGFDIGGAGGSALGTIMGGVAPLFGGQQRNSPDNMMNDLKGGLTQFLAQGGGQRNAENALQSTMRNMRMMDGPIGDFIQANNPAMLQTIAGSEGFGQGGGLGFRSGVQDFLKENDPEFVDTSPGILKQILGTVTGIGAGLLGGG